MNGQGLLCCGGGGSALSTSEGKHWKRRVQACKWGCWALLCEVFDGSGVDRYPKPPLRSAKMEREEGGGHVEDGLYLA